MEDKIKDCAEEIKREGCRCEQCKAWSCPFRKRKIAMKHDWIVNHENKKALDEIMEGGGHRFMVGIDTV